MSDRRAIVEAFSAAWEARDLAGVMQLMADDCSFHSSVGPGPGSRYEGRTAVEQAFAVFLDAPPDPYTTSGPVEILVADEFAVTRWIGRTHRPGEEPLLSAACDIFEFDGSAISAKDTYRKVLGPAPR